MPLLRFEPPFVGVQRNRESSSLSLREAEDALNVDLDKGNLRKRLGLGELLDLSAHGAIRGIYNYRKNDGDIYFLVKAGDKLFSYKNRGEPMSLFEFSSTDADTLVSFATVNNRVYFTTRAELKVTDGEAVFTAQLLAPQFPPTAVASTTSGVLKGTYDYKVSYFSSTWGQESPSSAVTATVSPDEKQVTLSAILGSVDSRVDKVRIYRRKVSVGEVLWSLVATIENGQSTYTDNILDEDVNYERIAPLTEAPTNPIVRFLAYQADTLFLAGEEANPTLLYYTRAGQPWVVDRSIEIGGGGDSDPITGLHAFRGIVVVHKRNSIWTVSGNSPETFFVRKIFGGVGCRSHWSIVERDELEFFLGERGFYAFDGASAPVEISDPIRPDLLERDQSQDEKVVGIHDPERGMLLWGLTASPGDEVNSTQWAYFYRNARQVEAPSWCKWQFASPLTYTGPLDFSSSRFFTYGGANGKVHTLVSTSDDGTAFPCFWQTGKLAGGRRDRFKRWTEFAVKFVPAPEGVTSLQAVLSCLLNEDTATTTVLLPTQDDPVARTHIGRSSRDIRLKLAMNQSSTNQEIEGFWLFHDTRGRA